MGNEFKEELEFRNINLKDQRKSKRDWRLKRIEVGVWAIVLLIAILNWQESRSIRKRFDRIEETQLLQYNKISNSETQIMCNWHIPEAYKLYFDSSLNRWLVDDSSAITARKSAGLMYPQISINFKVYENDILGDLFTDTCELKLKLQFFLDNPKKVKDFIYLY